MTTEKFPLIVFSGGVDSTYMLNAALEKGDVWTLYVDGAQGENKSKAEIETRKNILKYFADKHKEGSLKGEVLEDYVVKIQATGTIQRNYHSSPTFWMVDYDFNNRRTMFNQPLQWLTGINYVVNPLRISEIQLGYITGDQMAVHLQDLSDSWLKLMSITHTDVVPLAFPLKYFNKKKIFGCIERELLDMAWVCEHPRNLKPCLRCDKCLEYSTTYHSCHNVVPERDLAKTSDSSDLELTITLAKELTEDESDRKSGPGLIAITEPGNQSSDEQSTTIPDPG